MLVPILEPVAWYFRLVARLSRDPFFVTSGGRGPLGSILASPEAPLFLLSDLFEDSSCKFATKLRDFRATDGTNHTFKKNK